jgi:UDP-glucuronate 4-epimerase
MKRIFITGMAGFIGFHLAQKIRFQGDDVLGYDNFNAYYDPNLKRARAAELNKLGLQIVEDDLLNRLSLENYIKEYQPTHIVHLAAQAGVRYSLQDPYAYLQSNIEGFLNILEICRKFPTIPLIYASSSSVYGLNTEVPFGIENRTDHQASFYGVTKKTNELMAHTYHHLFGIPVTGLRFFTVYGPWGRPDMAYFSFTKALLEKQPIAVYNQGEMSRDFTYIDDIIDGIMAAIDLAAPYALFNLGNHHPESLLTLISSIEKEIDCQASLNLTPMQQGDVQTTYADIEESIKQLNFHPKISLKQGIKKFIKWYREFYKI